MKVLLTGATGFVGMEVLLRLLRRGDDVVCVVRGKEPSARLQAAMDTIGVPHALRGRARALPGDVTEPLPAVPGDIDVVVHCAASVSFGLDLEEARRINVGGTRNALDAAARAGARYVHVSTAYVAGRSPGLFFEDDLFEGQEFRNSYEQAKAEAEAVVRASDLDTVVLRPSIIMGESGSGWTASFNVLYWPLRAFSRGLIEAVPADPENRIDIVPVDFVADAIVHVACECPDIDGTLALVAGADAVTVEELVDLACERFGRPRPRLLTALAGGLEERSAEAAQYAPYFDMDVVFDDARSRALLGAAGIRPPHLRDYFPRLVSYAEEARWGKAPQARAG